MSIIYAFIIRQQVYNTETTLYLLILKVLIISDYLKI